MSPFSISGFYTHLLRTHGHAVYREFVKRFPGKAAGGVGKGAAWRCDYCDTDHLIRRSGYSSDNPPRVRCQGILVYSPESLRVRVPT